MLSIPFNLFSQQIIFEQKYSQLPFELRIDNSGIYSIASFDVDNDKVYFSSFNKPGIFQFAQDGFIAKNTHSKPGRDFVFNEKSKMRVEEISYETLVVNEFRLFRKNFMSESSVLEDEDGFLTNKNDEKFSIVVPNRNQLIINTNIPGINREMYFTFPSNLACADLIGIDKVGNTFMVVEKYISDIPLQIEREVLVVSKMGEIKSSLILPTVKYLFTLKDLQIDEDGNVYHLLSFPEKVQIIKWNNLTWSNNDVNKYIDEVNKQIHFNYFVPTDEYKSEISALGKTVSGVSRSNALRIADTYVLHQYSCTSSNLAPTDVTGPDGDVVRTPDWLVAGVNARIPYKWGGFNTIEQFDAGLANGKYAGDINTNGVSSHAYGVDCSGFVSRCWNLSYHASTAYMPNITTQYSSWDDLKPGDAIHKVGHVRLFVKRNTNGSFKVVEAAGRNWDVSYWSFTASDLTAYTPRYYNGMEVNYNNQSPVLLSAEAASENQIALNWDGDSAGILGYRIYSSQDGSNWTMILNEANCKYTSAEVAINNSEKYFRVASVKNDSPDFSESNWSNVLGASYSDSEKKALIVNGFERETGSWQGDGNSFVVKYGRALKELAIDFVSIKNSELQNNLFQLENYDYVFWILGDESTGDETFNTIEQQLVKNYLNSGGSLFVSGSEIGWDLYYKGSASDKDFYNNFLKANYISDDAASSSVLGVENSAMDGCEFNIGQTYEEDYPDEIGAFSGSALCMNYSNDSGAGVQFAGYFDSSKVQSSLIYLAFPLESTADDESFNLVISNSIDYFNSNPVLVENQHQVISSFSLEQNYPNPFNPTTKIRYAIPLLAGDESLSASGGGGLVTLKVYDILGNEVAILVDEYKPAGNYEINFNAEKLSSGVYFYTLTADEYFASKKLILLK
jgi:hypothetical protein